MLERVERWRVCPGCGGALPATGWEPPPGLKEASWPAFPRPDQLGEVTALDVAEAGVMIDFVEGHAALAQRWAEAVRRARARSTGLWPS